jgi:hypothetical protein
MHKLAAVVLTVLVLFTSVLPPALGARRETNADRFRRGAPPLPPTRRDGAYQPQPSSKPTVSGFLVLRDLSGLHNLGYIENNPYRGPLIGMSPLNSPESARLQATFSGSDHTLVATNALFPGPYFLGTTFPSPNDPNEYPPEELLFTNVPDGSGAEDWSYDSNTGELTIALPKPSGGTVPAVFALDVYQNALELVTDVPTFLSATAASEPSDQQPILVRVFFG